MTSWLDPQFIGEVTLVIVGAVVFGYIISRIWPKRANPKLFGTLAAFAVVGGLSYLGHGAAGIALYILIAALLVFGIAAVAL